jgi:hypothetical protein
MIKLMRDLCEWESRAVRRSFQITAAAGAWTVTLAEDGLVLVSTSAPEPARALSQALEIALAEECGAPTLRVAS